ncbi:hypothetical protein PK69_07960 [Xanthomonas phaseoli pv. phaseoli]|uniref:Uncharacterized protein n=1 Tax=Xanthomonas campestris pv. phaseoli TaxID=317013 RepID=A0AB34QKQ6_XANCH|nr:hypothetical protein AC609_04175 [Xanthomonas phaseoli pv. phaseoli]AZU32505.1 hypothetical protein AC801_22965 [Xanthomonas sp. ISO98C4]KUF20717.1 hypothetical protein AO826_17440 [Xanthomonas phaseoli pv. manihotis]AZU24698.1 hypothetical protein AC611_04180 [Xanthomonas phaseoli pv. phaseoli]AZU33465.1 hypothetical protein AC610_04175 [Xanthomonas phaseoli pv. phaseoli]
MRWAFARSLPPLTLRSEVGDCGVALRMTEQRAAAC